MLKRYAIAQNRSAIVAHVQAVFDVDAGRQAQALVEPGDTAPVVVRGDRGSRFLRDLRWGMPRPGPSLAEASAPAIEPDVVDLSDTSEALWRPCLEPAQRCLIAMTAFHAPDPVDSPGQATWFALGADQPLAYFAGVWQPLPKSGSEASGAFARLATGANDDVAAADDALMPVILTQPAEWTRWLSDAPWSEVADLQQPLHNGLLLRLKFSDVDGV